MTALVRHDTVKKTLQQQPQAGNDARASPASHYPLHSCR